jgi:hypothetical protein
MVQARENKKSMILKDVFGNEKEVQNKQENRKKVTKKDFVTEKEVELMNLTIQILLQSLSRAGLIDPNKSEEVKELVNESITEAKNEMIKKSVNPNSYAGAVVYGKGMASLMNKSKRNVEDEKGKSKVLKILKKNKPGSRGKYTMTPKGKNAICPKCGTRKLGNGIGVHVKSCQGLERFEYDTEEDTWTCTLCNMAVVNEDEMSNHDCQIEE